MGKTYCIAKLENVLDTALVANNIRTDVRTITLKCLVDTGASKLFLPQSEVDRLGLTKTVLRKTFTGAGPVERWAYSPVQITILDRSTTAEPIAIPDETQTPPLVGYLILQDLALVVDPKAETLGPNAETGDGYYVDMFFTEAEGVGG